MVENLLTLLMLIFLQAVLGFDNLLYISLESKRVEEAKQNMVRYWGVGLAIVLRIVFLVVIMWTLGFDAEGEQEPAEALFKLDLGGVVFEPTFHALLVLGGGLFIVYTAIKEISHMLSVEDFEHGVDGKAEKKSPGLAIASIVVMNLVFSFDSILSAIALTKVLWVMATAIIISGVAMVLMANRVAEFLKKNRMFEVLGLFILLIVGVMLLSEGGHLAHLSFWGHEVHAMTKTTFYFSIGVVVLVDIVQTRYQKKLDNQRKAAKS